MDRAVCEMATERGESEKIKGNSREKEMGKCISSDSFLMNGNSSGS